MNFEAILNNPKTAAIQVYDTIGDYFNMTNGHGESFYTQRIAIKNADESKRAEFAIERGDKGTFQCYVTLQVANCQCWNLDQWKDTKWIKFDNAEKAQAYLNKKSKQFSA